MYIGYSFQEITILLLAIPLLVMLIVAMLNFDTINNFILKTEGSNKLNSVISNKEAWQAGFTMFYTLLWFSVLTIIFLYIYDSITEGQWFINIFRYIFLIVLVYVGFLRLQKAFN